MPKVGIEGEIEDHQTHVLDLAEANRRPNQIPVWQHLYSAKSAYQVVCRNPPSANCLGWPCWVELYISTRSWNKRWFTYLNQMDSLKPTAWAGLVDQLQTNSSLFDQFYYFYHRFKSWLSDLKIWFFAAQVLSGLTAIQHAATKLSAKLSLQGLFLIFVPKI